MKTFANLAKSVKVTGATKKTKQLTEERNVFGQLILLSLSYPLYSATLWDLYHGH